ncbi:MAG: hypothetical protein ACQ9MH_00950 [Nitrospinales bacterium]
MANKIVQNDAYSRLEDLVAVTEKLSIEIEYSNLSDNEIAVQSGYCKYKGQEMIILDKNLPPEFQVSIILKILKNFNLDDIYVASWIREHFESEKIS